MLRANAALVAMTGFDDEADQLAHMKNLASDWYVQPGRRQAFLHGLAQDGCVRGFVSEVWRHRTGQRLWVSENAHVVRDAQGQALFFEGTVEDITERVRAQATLTHSEEWLRLISSQVPGLVFVVFVHRDGRREFRFVSAGVKDIYEFEAQELMRDPDLVTRYRHPDDRHLLAGDDYLVARGLPDEGSEYRVLMPDGRVKWLFRRSCAVSETPEGHLRVGVLMDISSRKQAELALIQSEAVWKLALDSSGDGVWDWNLGTKRAFFSPSIPAMFGYTEEEVGPSADAMRHLTHPDDVPLVRAELSAHLAGRASRYRCEHRVLRKDGDWTWVLSRGMVIERDASGQALRMVGTFTDISSHKQAEARQRQLEAQLRESQKMEAIGTLAGGVAHDFNNLLAAILGNLTLAQEELPPDHVAGTSLDEIHRAAVRARHLVQQILTFSRRQGLTLKRQAVGPLVTETLALMRALLPAGVRLRTPESQPNLDVMADATQLQQVLMNLCTNAWQSFDGDAGEVSVEFSALVLSRSRAQASGDLAPGRYVVISVKDNGPGIAPDKLDRIFEPFFTTKAPGTGTGLGLSVVHGIVKTHGGAIEVSSQVGKGTRFDVLLPRCPDEADSAFATTAPAALVPDAVEAFTPPPPSHAERHVVYVDDYEALEFLVERALRKQGFRVNTFSSGEAALDWMILHEGHIDLVVTDHNMPGMSGLAFAQALLRLRPTQRVALMSGYVDDALLAEAAHCGVVSVLPKQDRMEALTQSIAALLDPLADG